MDKSWLVSHVPEDQKVPHAETFEPSKRDGQGLLIAAPGRGRTLYGRELPSLMAIRRSAVSSVILVIPSSLFMLKHSVPNGLALHSSMNNGTYEFGMVTDSPRARISRISARVAISSGPRSLLLEGWLGAVVPDQYRAMTTSTRGC